MPSVFSPSRLPFLKRVEKTVKNTVVGLLRVFFGSKESQGYSLEDVTSVIVIRQHDQLGDMLCAVPLLRALRRRFPRAHITLIANPVNYAIMQHHPYIDELLNYDKRLFFRRPTAFFRFYQSIRNRRYDLAVVPATVSLSLTSSILAYLSGAAIRVGPERLQGQENPVSFLFNVRTTLDWSSDSHRHQTLRTIDVVKPLAISPSDFSHRIGITDDERSEAARFLASLEAEHDRLVGFHPGAGKIPNRWPPDRFAAVANSLFEQLSAGIVVTAGPMDDEPLHLMVRHLRCPHLVVRRKTIREVAAIISRLTLFVTNDTGVMHVAAGVETPTLSLFGPTDPRQWAPLGGQHRYIASRTGRIEDIEVGEVLRTATAILS